MIGLLVLAAAFTMDPATQSDFVCAQVTARAIRIQPASERTSYERAHAYYLGRLSAREQAPRWRVRWEDRINDAIKNTPIMQPQFRDQLFKCMDFYIDEMPDLASE